MTTLTAEKFATQTKWRTFHSGNTGAVITVPNPGRASGERAKEREMAVYTYLQTLRSLGKRRVSSADVSEALDLPEKVVRRIMSEMTDRGVKAV